jgi:amino acid permease
MHPPGDVALKTGGSAVGAMKRGRLTSSIRKHVEDHDHSSKWYHATFHVVAAMVGAGVIGLPKAMALLLWPGGTVALVAAFLVTLYTSYQLVYMCQLDGKRFLTYDAVASIAFGKWAKFIVLPFQIFVMVGTGIAYIILSGTLVRSIFVILDGDVGPKLMISFAIYTGCQCVLSLLPSLEKLRFLSFIALVASISYCLIAIILCGIVGIQPNVQYSLLESNALTRVSDILQGLGIVAFAFGGHAIMVEVEATLSMETDPQREMMKGVYLAYIIVAVLYFGVAISGYIVFGVNVKDDIFLSLATATTSVNVSVAVIIAEVLVIVHITFAFQVFMMPVFGMIDKKFPAPNCGPDHPDHLAIGRIVGHRIIRRWSVLAAQWLVASAFPFFGNFIGFIGGIGTTMLTFVLPPIMYLLWMKYGFKQMVIFHVCSSISIIVIYTIVGLAASTGSLLLLATNTTFVFFQ